MFLELHLIDNNEKILLNINRINSIHQTKEKTEIYCEEVIYIVRESYEEIKDTIDYYLIRYRE